MESWARTVTSNHLHGLFVVTEPLEPNIIDMQQHWIFTFTAYGRQYAA
jgi:hypothetical protein